MPNKRISFSNPFVPSRIYSHTFDYGISNCIINSKINYVIEYMIKSVPPHAWNYQMNNCIIHCAINQRMALWGGPFLTRTYPKCIKNSTFCYAFSKRVSVYCWRNAWSQYMCQFISKSILFSFQSQVNDENHSVFHFSIFHFVGQMAGHYTNWKTLKRLENMKMKTNRKNEKLNTWKTNWKTKQIFKKMKDGKHWKHWKHWKRL